MDPPDGRKIHTWYENPLDNIFIAIAEMLNIHVFYPLSFTPNMITTLSLVFGLLCAFALYKDRYILGVVLFVIAYILDCADGNYARRYNMITVFGDYYDHISDLLKAILVVLIILYKKDLSTTIKVIFVLVTVVLFFASTVHLGCQEKVYNPQSNDSLSYTKLLCTGNDPKEMITRTRYFGVGTLVLFIVCFLIYLGYKS